MSDDEKTEPPPRPFSAWLAEQGRGRLHTELTEGLAGLVAAVADTGKAGTLTLTIKVKPYSSKKGHDSAAMLVEDDVKVKAPASDRPESLYFVDHHSLVRTNPEQQPITGLRNVSDPATTRKASQA